MFGPIFIAVLATIGAISNANAAPAGSDGSSTLLPRTENPAASFALWSDTQCHSGQVDYHVPDGPCAKLDGSSMQLWWLHDTCRSMSTPECSGILSFPRRPLFQFIDFGTLADQLFLWERAVFAYKTADCSNKAEFQVRPRTCYDVRNYIRYRVFCH